jgi:protease IV
MNTFFKVFFACLLAIVVVVFLGFFILIGIGASFSKTDKPVVKGKTVLFLDLSQPIAEQGREDDFSFGSFNLESTPGLHDMIAAIKHGIGDSSVKALYLLSRGNGMGMAASQELGAAIDSFKASGKPVVAFADIMPQRAYEIAHRGSHIFVQPGGAFEWVGMHAELLFFKNLLDRLYVKPEVFYAGQFKSATEPFRMTKMSDANRLQLQSFLNALQQASYSSIAKHRGIDAAKLNNLANTLAVRTAEQAAAAGLISGVLYDDQVRDTLRELAGLKKDENIPFMTLTDYRKATKKAGTGERIAVVYADGDIVDGKGEDNNIGSANFRSFLSKLRSDSKVKAVVLRINSPGGSAIASEFIWRELKLIQAEKPLVVSMGNYAASGGYYMAAAADSIFAMPGTLTGSIGVFSLTFDAQKMFNDKLGLNFDGVGTNTYSDNGSITRPMTAFEKQVAQNDVDSIYRLFKQRVMDGRQLSSAQVDSIAQGRIWSGGDALGIRLVDYAGGLDAAIACAARMAKLEKYSLREYPRQRSLMDKLFGDKEDPNTTQVRLLSKQLTPQHAAWLKEYHHLTRMNRHPQARLPFLIQNP